MADLAFHLIDNNTGEEVYASDALTFDAAPVPEHRIHDPELMERYGGPAVVDRVEPAEGADGEINIYIDGVEERLNGQEIDQNYRRS
jgi:hypothetical protein